MKQEGQFLLFTREELQDWLLKTVIHRKIVLIQNHHTEEPDYRDFKGSNYFDLLNAMKQYHMHPDPPATPMKDIAQNLTTFPDGLCAVCRDLEEEPAGIYGANQGGICIENLGNFDIGQDQMTPDQWATIILLNAWLCRKFGIPVTTGTIVYHHWYDLKTGQRTNGTGEVKSCPGTAFFGGNTVAAAQNYFLPQISYQIGLMNLGSAMAEATPK